LTGLFKRAIAASGSATCPWAINGEPDRISRKYAGILGASESDAEDPAKRIRFLRSLRSKVIAEKISDLLLDEVRTRILNADFLVLRNHKIKLCFFFFVLFLKINLCNSIRKLPVRTLRQAEHAGD